MLFRSRSTAYRRQLAHKIAALTAKGFSQRDISNHLGIGLATVNRLLRGCVDEKGFENLKMCGFEDEVLADDEICAGEEGFADAPMTNDVMTNDQEKAAALCDSLPWEGREGYSEPGITYEERFDGEHTTVQVIQSPPMINDVMTNNQKEATPLVIPKLASGMKISTIDKLLTPELLEHILGTKTQENSIRGKGSDDFNEPNLSEYRGE